MKFHLLFATVIAAAAFSGCQQDSHDFNIDRKSVNGLPTVTATETASSTAKVDAIDYGNRSIALTGQDGKTEIFYVSRAVRNFPQIKKGDTVKVDYAARLSAHLRKVDEAPSTDVSDALSVADLGQKPGLLATRKAQIQCTVESIDYQSRVVKLKPANGNTITLTASPELKDLDKVHSGDQVVFDYTEAISINVE